MSLHLLPTPEPDGLRHAVQTMVADNSAGFTLMRFVIGEAQAAADEREPVSDSTAAAWASQLRFLLDVLDDRNDEIEAALRPAMASAA